MRLPWEKPEPLDQSELDFNLKYSSCYWRERGISEESVRDFGLVQVPEAFEIRFPLRSLEDNHLMGYCTREWDTHPFYPQQRKAALKSGEIGKYNFEPGARKSLSLFGVERLTQRERIYVYEGPVDVVNFWQRTGQEAVSPWGKDLSDHQLEFLIRFQHVIWVADKDEDRGGLKAAEKAWKQLKPHTNADIGLIVEPFKDYTEAVMEDVSLPEITILPKTMARRFLEVERLYRKF